MLTRDKSRILIFDADAEWCKSVKVLLAGRQLVADIVTKTFDKCLNKLTEKVYVSAIINVHDLQDPKADLKRLRTISPSIGIIIVLNQHDPTQDALLWNPDPLADHSFCKRDHEVTKIGPIAEGLVKNRGLLADDITVVFADDVDDILTGYAHTWSGATRIRGDNLSLRFLKTELQLIISRMFHGAESLPIAKTINVEPFGSEAGHSGSSMFKITPAILISSARNKSAVLKFGPIDEIRTEAGNYDTYVEWFLTVDQTVRKIAYAEASRFAAILYSYPRDVVGGYTPYAEYIRTHPVDRCVSIIEKMFNTKNQHWLSVDGSKFVQKDDLAFQNYYVNKVIHASLYELRDVHFQKMCKELNNLERNSSRKICEVTDSRITFQDPACSISVINPMRFIEQPLINKIKMTIIHGDLHGHNILIDERDRYFFIDFFYTGFGDIYRDFVELELSVRYDLFSSRTLPEEERLTSIDSATVNGKGLFQLYRLEKALIDKTIWDKDPKDPLIKDNPAMAKAYAIISAIRYYARANCPNYMSIYYMGLAASSLKALKYFYPLDVKLSRVIIAALYADLVQKKAIK